ncbi:hypothetical protein HCN44_011378 [Aphidius gifuensis]|uniref:Serpin domain-containing protein n=1 Tax=Aphidius gifuensis TaxID=684658 RepID=A0A835CRN0_APHGI|nr:hypothetical protein HCN44_011378 [Aphidius gifuensis]
MLIKSRYLNNYWHLLNFIIFNIYLIIGFIIQSVLLDNNMESDSSQIALFTMEAESCRVFSSNLFKGTTEVYENSKNIILSPLSVHVTLSYLCHGARENTANEMMMGLSINTNDWSQYEMHIGYRNLLASINETSKADLIIANSVFCHESVKLKSLFSSLGTDYYNFEIKNINFDNNIESVGYINDWIIKKTNNKINDVIKSDTKLILVNAIYFKGTWQHPFDPDKTSDRDFYITKLSSIKVPMMTNKQRYAYGKLPQYKSKFIELPYTIEDLSMMIILPDDIDGLSLIEKNFDWNLVVDAEIGRGDVILHLPKFKIQCTTNLKEILQNIGFKNMFENAADFSGISETPLKVSKVIQKAFIEVNEEGSEAAAATVVKMRLKRSLEEPEEFNVNRPFMIAIRHKPSNIPLFIGRVCDIGKEVIVKDEL